MRITHLLLILFAVACFHTVSCQIGEHSDDRDSIINEIKSDPLRDRFIENFTDVTEYIMRGGVDLESSYNAVKNPEDLDFCNPTAELLEIRGYEYYTNRMCEHISLLTQLKEKYPVINDLTKEERKEILMPQKFYTQEQAIEMLSEKKFNNQ